MSYSEDLTGRAGTSVLMAEKVDLQAAVLVPTWDIVAIEVTISQEKVANYEKFYRSR